MFIVPYPGELFFKHWYFLQLLLEFHLLLNYVYLFSHVYEFSSVNVILKIFNIFNKSNYLVQQYCFNHFHFLQKGFLN